MEELRFRQIHMDFHTSPLISGVGEEFKAKEFAQTLKEAYVNSVTCFAKCHHGMSYYPTKVGYRHPQLKIDLLGEMIKACHELDINVPVYISVMWDEHMAQKHPEWRIVEKDGKLAGAGPFEPGWKSLCMNSPYIEYVAKQTEEVVKKYNVDGIFFDITGQDRCFCTYCLASMKELKLNPENAEDQAKHVRAVRLNALTRLYKSVRRFRPKASVFFNGNLNIGMGEKLKYYTHLEIESLPSGGWGYNFFPLYVRYYQTLGKNYMGMTARFHKSWADFGGLKNKAALEYECFQMIASGARCSIGDQLHPRGKLDEAAYDEIKDIYKDVAEKEPWLKGAKPLVEIAILNPTNPGLVASQATKSTEGAMRVLLESHYQFQIIDENADFTKYRLLILADEVRLDKNLAAKIREYIKRGGRLLLSHLSGLAQDKDEFILPEAGIEYSGKDPYSPNYICLEPALLKDIPALDYVCYEGGLNIKPLRNAEILAWVGHPYFNRTWEHFSSHFQTPLDKITKNPAIVKNRNIIYISYPVFSSYLKHGVLAYKKIVQNALELLLPEPLLKTNAPSGAEITLLSQKGRVICHVLYYVPQRRAIDLDIIEDVVPLIKVKVKVKTAITPSRVYLAPQNEDLEYNFDEGFATCTIPQIKGHQIVVFEL